MIQRQVACFSLSAKHLRHPQSSHQIILNPQTQALLIPPPLVWKTGIAHATNPINPLLMKILIWNCRGASNPYFHRNFGDLIRTLRPEISIIMETRISGQRAKDISSSLGFDNVHRSNASSFKGGIWILYNEHNTNLEILFMTDQAIHAFVEVCASNPSSNWILSAICASLDLASRINLWEDLASFTFSHTFPWLLVGDFNETLYHYETFSNSPPNHRRMSICNDFLNNYNLMDLRYRGQRFMWTNKRDNGLVMKCLDRALANPQWKLLFNDSYARHLPRTSSDHHPILLHTTLHITHSFKERPFRLETIWFNDPVFLTIIQNSWNNHFHNITRAMEEFTHRVKIWNSNSFRNIFHRKKRLLA